MSKTSKSQQKTSNKRAVKSQPDALKATAEQVNLARLLNTGNDDAKLKQKLEQIQECTACDLESAISALHDADNDVARAIDNLLDPKYGNEWQDTISKKPKSKRQSEQKSKANIDNRFKKDSNSSLNGRTESVDSNNKNSRMVNGKRQNNKFNPKSHAKPSELHAKKTNARPELEDLTWELECGDWKGEAVEVVNSCADIPKNIHEDSELLKLVTSEVVEPEPANSEENDAVPTEVAAEVEKEKENEEVNEIAAEEPSETDSGVCELKERILKARERFCSKYTHTKSPPPCRVPDVPVFVVPNPLTAGLSGRVTLQKAGFTFTLFEPAVANETIPKPAEIVKNDQVAVSKPVVVEQQPMDAPNSRMVAPGQFSYPAPSPQVAMSGYNPGAYKDSYGKIAEHNTAGGNQNRAPSQPTSTFDAQKLYGYNLLGELSQNIKQSGLEVPVGKSDAFTQSIASTQSESAPPPYTMPQAKPTMSNLPPQMGKPMAGLPTNSSQQQQQPAMPTTQQMHQVMHPGLPPLINQYHQNAQLFNYPAGSAGPAVAHHQLYDMDSYHVFQQQQQQQQRMFYEVPTQAQQGEQLASNSNAPVDTKTNVPPPPPPLHQVTAPNVSSGIAYLHYAAGMVPMIGYPNPFLGQQQQQQTQQQAQQQTQQPAQSQSPGHGGSPLSHLTNPQQQQQTQAQQFSKPGLNSVSNYAGYQGMRQNNYEESGDMYYPNVPKQVSFKHNAGGGMQGFYNASKAGGGGGELPLGGKMGAAVSQQQAAVASVAAVSSQGGGGQNAAPVSLYQQQAAGNNYAYYPQHFALAAAAAAAAAQQQQQATQQPQAPQNQPMPAASGVPGSRPNH